MIAPMKRSLKLDKEESNTRKIEKDLRRGSTR